MLTIETYLSLSPGKGIGLFTKERIQANSIWWIRSEKFDKKFLPEELDSLNWLTVQFIKTYGFLEPTGNWYLCIDNARFSNHSVFPNTGNNLNTNGELISCSAKRDIEVGEEILCNYKEICLVASKDLGFKDVENES